LVVIIFVVRLSFRFAGLLAGLLLLSVACCFVCSSFTAVLSLVCLFAVRLARPVSRQVVGHWLLLVIRLFVIVCPLLGLLAGYRHRFG
jgi:hypothetical protein